MAIWLYGYMAMAMAMAIAMAMLIRCDEIHALVQNNKNQNINEDHNN
jgi:hypothetical protein